MSARGVSGKDRHNDVQSSKVFEILAVQNADMLMSFLRSLVRSQDLVEDLFQETMLTAWRKLEEFDRTKSFGPWLRGIAANKVKQFQAKQGRDQLLSCDEAVMASLEHRFIVAYSDGESSPVVDRLLLCLKKLPDTLRVPLGLVYEGGFALRSVAGKLDVTEEAVKKRVQRGRKLLAECMHQAVELS